MPVPVDPLPFHDDREETLEAARSGDEEAQAKLLGSMRTILKRLAYEHSARFIKKNWRDSDVSQAAFLKVLEEIKTFRGCTPEQLDAWLSVIVDRTVAIFARESRAAKRDIRREVSAEAAGLEESLGDAAPAADAIAIRREELSRLNEAVSRLPEEHARVVRLRLEELSWAEIGQRMHRGAEAAAELHRRACQELKKDLKEP